jgi:hypothetical protein
MPIRQVPRLIGELYQTVNELNTLFPGRPFTPDGHLVGSIGEVVAAYVYGVDLAPCSTPAFDGRLGIDGPTVEIKLTSREGIDISEADRYADYLIVMRLSPSSGFEEIYAGQFPHDLIRSRKMNKRRFTTVPVNILRRMNPSALDHGNRLSELNQLFTKVVNTIE